jgi:signal transduction histidine kinase
MKAFWLSLAITALVFSAGDGFSATPKEAAVIVRAASTVTNAVQFYKDNGKEKALAEFNNPKGRFNFVELYIFAYDMTGTMVAEPRNKRLVGMHLINLTDPEGKFYVKAIVDMATERGKGSVSYHFENPDTEAVERRRVYLQRVGDVIICCILPPQTE